MKTVKLVLGILSMVLFVIIAMQSCAAGVGNALQENGEVSGSAGFLTGACMLAAGIVGVATRKGRNGGAFTAGGLYLAGALLGFVNAGSYSDLKIWAIISAIFGITYIVGTIISSKKNGK